MRAIFLVTLLLAQIVLAEEKTTDKKGSPGSPTSAVTVKDAKKICKDKGREGAELLKCIKETNGAEK